MFEDDHCAFIKLVERLRAEVEQQGDVAFADALNQCMLSVSGGDLDCPMGQLILEDTLRSGKLPGAAFSSPSALPQSRSGNSPVQRKGLKRSEVFGKLRHLLKQDAMRRQDTRYLDALEACERLTEGCDRSSIPDCPVRRLLQEHKDGQGPGGE